MAASVHMGRICDTMLFCPCILVHRLCQPGGAQRAGGTVIGRPSGEIAPHPTASFSIASSDTNIYLLCTYHGWLPADTKAKKNVKTFCLQYLTNALSVVIMFYLFGDYFNDAYYFLWGAK